MKILQINNFHYLNGGADKVYLETARLLTDHGHQVQFFSTRNTNNHPSSDEKYFPEDVNFHLVRGLWDKVRASVRFIYSFQARRNLNALLKASKPDVAHLHIFQSRLSCSILPVLKKHGVPIIFSFHEYKILCPVYTLLDGSNQICEACQGKRFYHCALKKCHGNNLIHSLLLTIEAYFRNSFFPIERYGDHFIMVSDFIRQKHLQYKPELATRTSRLYNFNSIELHKDEPPIRENYFLYFGRLSYEKGILTMLKAFRQKPEFTLKIVGAGPLEEEIQDFVRFHNMKNVELLGFKQGNDLKRVIRRAAYSIVPSEWYESFGLIVIESMIAKTPVIASNIGAIPELICDNQTGFLFPAGEYDKLVEKMEIAYVLNNETYEIMCEQGLNFVTKYFRPEDYYTQLIRIYENVIASYN